MKHFPQVILVALIFWGLACAPRREATAPSALLALVNGTAIREDDLRFRLNLEKFKYDDKTFKESSRFEALKGEILERMIRNQMIIDWGLKAGIILTPEEQALGMEGLKRGYTPREFELMLQERQIPLAKWRDMALESVTVEKILRETLSKNQKILPSEAEKYYEEHVPEFEEGEAVRVRHLVTDTFEKAAKLRKEILTGENFAKLAILHSLSPDRSNGGELDFFARGTYPKEFDDACFHLKEGELSPVVKSPYGYHLFKLIEKRPPRTIPFSEAKSKIEAEILKKKVAQSYPAWLDAILSQAQIRVYRENLEKLKP